MTRKDYIKIAAALAQHTRQPNREEMYGVGYADGAAACAHSIAQVLADDNSRFNREKFYAACGVQS